MKMRHNVELPPRPSKAAAAALVVVVIVLGATPAGAIKMHHEGGAMRVSQPSR